MGWWAVPSLRGFVLRGPMGFCWAGGYVWLRYRLWRCRPKAGDAVRPGGCIFVQVALQRWWSNRVPVAWVVVRGLEVDALLSGPAVVGQDGVCDGGVVVVPERVVGPRAVFQRGANSRSQGPDVSVCHYVVPCCTGRGIPDSAPHRVQANHLVAGLTNTLGSLRSRPMPTPAAIPISPFVPRTAQPPYSHVGNSTRAELDRLGLTALRAMVDVEPYGSSDLGGDPSDDEPPSMTSGSPSEDDDPENPENPSGQKMKKKRKTRRPERRRSQEAKAIATSKIGVNLPEFTGKDLSEFTEDFGRFLRTTGQTHASGRVKCDLFLQCCKTKYLEKQVKQIVTKSATFADVLVALERQYPTYETDLSIRAESQNLAVLPNNPKPGRVSELLADLDDWAGRLTPGSYSSDDLLFWLVAKLPRELWDECRSTAERKAKALNYEDFCVLLLELALEKESNQHLNAYRPGGGGSGSHGKGYQGPRPGQGTTPKHARIMENLKELFWCDARDEQGHLQHSPDCEQRDCFVVQGKKQETNTGAKAKMPDHYRSTITCAFCGKRKHYEDECYHKQRLWAKLKGEDTGKGSGKGRGKGNGNDSGKGKSKGRGKGQDKNQGG